MSFSVILQNNESEKNRLDKSITDVATASGVLKGSDNIIAPTFLIEGDPSTFRNVNYLTVTEFNRKYFITDIIVVRKNLFQVTCHVDVLSTYATQIRENSAIIARQENDWNLYLNDGVFKVYQNPDVITTNFPSGFNSTSFALALAGSTVTPST